MMDIASTGRRTTRSFRSRLTTRFTATMAAALGTVAVLSYLIIRETLDREIDASILNVASIQAASITEPASGEMVFHEWELTPDEAISIRDLNRYAQVWTGDGVSLLRTRYITQDLPLDLAALDAAANGEIVWRVQSFDGIPIRSLYYPLDRFGAAHAHHVLQVAAPLEARNRTLRRFALLLTGIVLVGSAGIFAGSWWLAVRAVRPVHEIIDQAEAIDAVTLERRISAYADSQEYQRLVQVLNTMLARIDDSFRAQRRFTDNASHELRSPLTALRGELELARRRERSPEEYRRVIDSALEEVERLSRTTEDLLTLARIDAGAITPRFQLLELGESVRETVTRLAPIASASGIALHFRQDHTLPIQGDRGLVDRLAWNLIENAVKFTPPAGRVEVQVGRQRDGIVLSVADSGPGIPAEDLERVFERFYRGDDSRTPMRDSPGTGLGLSIARAIADVHGARISAANRPDAGACFTVSFPTAPLTALETAPDLQ